MEPFDKAFYYFKTVTIYHVHKIDKKTHTVRLTSGDRGHVAKAEDSHIVIERKWYPT